MRTLRAFFLRLQIREKAFLLIFVLLLVAVWASYFNRRAQKFYGAAHQTSVELSHQKLVLDNHTIIEEAEKKAADRLVPASTLDATRLYAAVLAVSNEAGLQNPRTGEQRDESGGGQFIFHTLQFTVNRSNWEALLRFYSGIQHRSPYITIDQFTLAADRANPSQLNATMRISSVEVVAGR